MDLKLIKECDGFDIEFDEVSDILNYFNEELYKFNDCEMYTLINHFIQTMKDVNFIEED